MKVLAVVLAGGVVACGSVNETPQDAAPLDDAAVVDMQVDAPPIACTQTTCVNSTLEVCGSGGTVELTQQCGLGCFTDGTRCNAITPSNGLENAIDQAPQQGGIRCTSPV